MPRSRRTRLRTAGGRGPPLMLILMGSSGLLSGLLEPSGLPVAEQVAGAAKAKVRRWEVVTASADLRYAVQWLMPTSPAPPSPPLPPSELHWSTWPPELATAPADNPTGTRHLELVLPPRPPLPPSWARAPR